MKLQNGGAEYIRAEIDRAVKNGTRRAIIKGDWLIEEAVRIPSDFELILDSCHLVQADGIFDNMFVNEHHGTELGKTIAGTDKNISILGRGGATLDGGKYNGLSEKTQLQNGMPHVSKNNLILFTNVDGFEMKNFTVKNQRWWAMNFIYCRNGVISGIHSEADDTCIDENGNEYHGLSIEHYYDMLRKQCDGIDIRQGCNHILIENITGFSGDDMVALTAVMGKMEANYAVDGLPIDISHVLVRNIVCETLAANVRLLCQGGAIMHDITVDGVEDTSGKSGHLLTHGIFGVRVGDTHLYCGRHATEEEFYNIKIRNVRSRADYALGLAGNEIKSLKYENIVAFDGAKCIENRLGEEGSGEWR